MPADAPLETRLVQVDPRKLKLLEKNARSMPEREFRQLVENIQRDGTLLGTVLIKETENEQLVLSGNHRVKASIAAGLPEITAIDIISEISDARALAIQLSQNAIVGKDDPNILRELYDSLDVLEQQYSGLTDTDLGLLDDPDFEKLRLGPPIYEEILIAFLPEDQEEFQQNLDRIMQGSKNRKVWLHLFAEYEKFFLAMLKTKDVMGIVNDAVTLSVMAELANERLEQIQAEQDEEEGESDAE
ncbi:MAG: ParB-like nuclease domain-containing protein [Nitratireductor sp.]|nr:ParB-like nuclease domain-containing protein [Nitratireductor sp.]